jgi:hypothetical protein
MTRLAWLADRVLGVIIWITVVAFLGFTFAFFHALGVEVAGAIGLPTMCGGL